MKLRKEDVWVMRDEDVNGVGETERAEEMFVERQRMFGECHAHVFMDGVNYKEAVKRHLNGVDEGVIRRHFEMYREKGIAFVRDGGDYLGSRKGQGRLRRSMGLITGRRFLPYTGKGVMGGLWGRDLKI